jgi:hypothetical protein
MEKGPLCLEVQCGVVRLVASRQPLGVGIPRHFSRRLRARFASARRGPHETVQMRAQSAHEGSRLVGLRLETDPALSKVSLKPALATEALSRCKCRQKTRLGRGDAISGAPRQREAPVRSRLQALRETLLGIVGDRGVAGELALRACLAAGGTRPRVPGWFEQVRAKGCRPGTSVATVHC